MIYIYTDDDNTIVNPIYQDDNGDLDYNKLDPDQNYTDDGIYKVSCIISFRIDPDDDITQQVNDIMGAFSSHFDIDTDYDAKDHRVTINLTDHTFWWCRDDSGSWDWEVRQPDTGWGDKFISTDVNIETYEV